MPDLGAPETRSSELEIDSDLAPADALPATLTPLRGVRRALLGLLHVLPKNALSRLMGRFASLRLPGPIQQAEIRLFAQLAGVDLSEAADTIDQFPTLQRFFTRALKPGARKIEGDEACMVSPCDGAWGESGRIEAGRLIQVKGRDYRVAELLGDEERAREYEGGGFATFYLSPRDYHRFHTPLAGSITHLDYHPGALWPVNSIGLQGIDGLFAKNERICAFLVPGRGSENEGLAQSAEPAQAAIAMVAVGATMVGSVKLRFDSLTTNIAGGRRVSRALGSDSPSFQRGEEWGHFEFGSTIVLLTPPGAFELDSRPTGEPLRLGQAIGRYPAG